MPALDLEPLRDAGRQARVLRSARAAGHDHEQGALAAFEARFANKETLAKRFGQLAELRNGIRHSRTVDEVTRKEGEAALLWFRQVLPS